jgi:hypothetical protein
MALELKIESLRARGELSAEERDRLVQLLKQSPPPAKKTVFFTPLRSFLLGMIVGVGIAYLTWNIFSGG